ncbi:hypothetical protein Zmor_020312 [Zophobas morio]|uniref:Fatty acid 2-hydroxylase n=2 Tax=Zophobas morio TaxID=2755281 RepID=A0AA38M9B4_9CUCU|nr:hypothetical protein Zmor_020312 [Zophobas morio]
MSTKTEQVQLEICNPSEMDESKQFRVNHGGDFYNIYDFLNNHPGGTNYVKPFQDREITQRMQNTQHSKAAYYLLREYKSGGRDTGDKGEQEDLEALVDWDKPMLSQVAGLGARYNEWVVSPVDRQLRLFGNPILESLTITPWYVVPLVWVPVIVYFIIYGARKYVQLTEDTSPVLPTVLSVISGIVLWTLIEYSLHRWVFHMEPSGKSKAMIYVHFAIHGLHHKVPFDPRRLVFPPFPAAVIAYVLYQICTLFVPESIIVLVVAGGLTGYVIYDMIHFYLHYGAPKEDSYFYHLKRYHNQHHFAHHDSGFGISSVFWDKIFGSAIKMRKLAMAIKW